MSTTTMNALTARFTLSPIRCHWRPIILASLTLTLLCLFWFGSRYPALFSRAAHVGQTLPSMTYSSQVMNVASDGPVWWRIVGATVHWRNGMKMGMTFGVLSGAFLHTVLRYYPLRIGKNLYLNSSKGARRRADGSLCQLCCPHRLRGNPWERARRSRARLFVQLAHV